MSVVPFTTVALMKAALAHASSPTLVILQAGDINTGACDQFRVLMPMARRFGAWVHVD